MWLTPILRLSPLQKDSPRTNCRLHWMSLIKPDSTAKTLTNKLSYRADIDGLRAIAVLAVIASHLPEKFLPSGFLGVDVFFAISGFVVTASLLGQLRTKLSQLYENFLARRV